MYDVSGQGLPVKIAFDGLDIACFEDMTCCILGPGKLYVIRYTESLEIPWCLKLFPLFCSSSQAWVFQDCKPNSFLFKLGFPIQALPSVILALCHVLRGQDSFQHSPTAAKP